MTTTLLNLKAHGAALASRVSGVFPRGDTEIIVFLTDDPEEMSGEFNIVDGFATASERDAGLADIVERWDAGLAEVARREALLERMPSSDDPITAHMKSGLSARPLPELGYDELDPGIRETVRWLRGLGYFTSDSGDGVSKPDDEREFDVPHVVVVVHEYAVHVDARDARDLWAEHEATISALNKAHGYDDGRSLVPPGLMAATLRLLRGPNTEMTMRVWSDGTRELVPMETGR